ncbi:MAG: pyridoxal-phosphate dependent enzyme, partial [Nevskiales bacterium]
LADGLACRTPDPNAMAIIWETVDRIVEVSEAEVAGAMRACFSDTHNVAEGAGAAALAAAIKLRGELGGQRIGLPLSGGNVDREVFAEVLRHSDP